MSQKHVASTEQAFVFIHLITTSPKEKETGSRWEPGVRTLQVAERQAAGFPNVWSGLESIDWPGLLLPGLKR